MRVFIVNDTSIRGGGHFGCQLVMQTLREQFDRVGIEIIGTADRGEVRVPREADLVVLNGEGSMHHGRFQHLVDIANHYPAVLINSVWQDNPHYQSLHNFKYIAVRESLSYASLPPSLPNAAIVPDVVFTSSTLLQFQKGRPLWDKGITDNVVTKGNNQEMPAQQAIGSYLSCLSKYKRLCIGRFHAIVVASVLRIPFSAWPSNTHKIRGMLKDMRIPHLHFDNATTAEANVPCTFDERIGQYAERARDRIDGMFEYIADLESAI